MRSSEDRFGDVERAITSGVLQRPLYLRDLLLSPLNGLGPLLFSGVVLALSVGSVRLALACFAIVCFFAGYPAIQFQQRHVFHLELIPLWLLALTVAGIFSWVGAVRTSGIDLGRATMTRLAGRVVGMALVLSLIVVAPLYALRARQDVTVTALLRPIRRCESGIAAGDTRLHGQGCGAHRRRRVARACHRRTVHRVGDVGDQDYHRHVRF